jgi:hypothetical protein
MLLIAPMHTMAVLFCRRIGSTNVILKYFILFQMLLKHDTNKNIKVKARMKIVNKIKKLK